MERTRHRRVVCRHQETITSEEVVPVVESEQVFDQEVG